MGCDRIELFISQSLKEVKLFDMPNLERWTLQEADDGLPLPLKIGSQKTLRDGALAPFLPSLEILSIYATNEMLSSICQKNKGQNMQAYTPWKSEAAQT